MDLGPIATIIGGVAALITAIGGVIYGRSKHRAESTSAQSQASDAIWKQVNEALERNSQEISCLQKEVRELRDSHAALQARHEIQAAENRALAQENRTIREALEEIAEWIHSLGVEIPEAIRRHLKSTKRKNIHG